MLSNDPTRINKLHLQSYIGGAEKEVEIQRGPRSDKILMFKSQQSKLMPLIAQDFHQAQERTNVKFHTKCRLKFGQSNQNLCPSHLDTLLR